MGSPRHPVKTVDSDGTSGMESILVVDDDAANRRTVERVLQGDSDRRIVTASSAKEAREQLAAGSFDVVITDISMPVEDGISLMQWAHEAHPGPSWIVLTGHGTLDTAVKALQLGAFDFIAKPVRVAPMRNAVRNAIAHRRLVAERDCLNAQLEESNQQLRVHVGDLEGACRLLEKQADAQRADLRRAALIQHALLPQEAPDLLGFRVEAIYRPSCSVGGDLYDVVQVDEHHVALIVADAAGHGLSAAMLAVLFHEQLTFVDGRPDPAAALELVNRSLCDRIAAPGLFITAACCVLNTKTWRLDTCSAGHTPLVLHRKNGGAIERIYHTGPALGLYPDATYAETTTLLRRGDRLLLHTDGLFDCADATDQPPSERVAALLQSTERERGSDVLHSAFGSWLSDEGSGDPQVDDVTLLLLLAEPGAPRLDNGLPPVLPLPSGRPDVLAAEMLVGRDAWRTTISLRGRGDWAASAVFHAACAAEIEERHPLVLDLTLCDHLDSTFLGTIHELTERAERADLEFRLQGVNAPVEALFEELGMSLVFDHVLPAMLPLPSEMLPLTGDPTDASRKERVLSAHESLAGLSERNRREFDPLLQLLRQEES